MESKRKSKEKAKGKGKRKLALKDKMQVWKQFEEELLNEENEWSEKLSADKNDEPCQNVPENDMVEALCCM